MVSNLVEKPTVFISRAGEDKVWAQWIATVLENGGYRTILQDFDFLEGQSFVERMNEAIAGADYFIPVLTPAYVSKDYTRKELNAAFASDRLRQEHRIIPLRLKACDVPPIISDLIFLDFVGKDDSAKREMLTRALKPGRRDRISPPPGAGNIRLVKWAALIFLTLLIGVVAYVLRTPTIPNGKGIEFVGQAQLSSRAEEGLRKTLSAYASYLLDLGITLPNAIKVEIDDNLSAHGCDHGCAHPKELVLLRKDSANPELLVHEFSHIALMDPPPYADEQWQYWAIEAGVANYLTTDFFNTPFISNGSLDQMLPLNVIPHDFNGAQKRGGMVWGSVLWKLRAKAGNEKKKVTKAVVRAWISLSTTSPPNDYQAKFLAVLKAAGADPAAALPLSTASSQ
jgi:hypothetical protein